MNVITLNISSIIGKSSAVLPADGKLVSDQLVAIVEKSPDDQIHLDFSSLEFVTSSFLNDAVGRFLLQYPNMKDNLVWNSDLDDGIVSKLKRTIRLAAEKGLRDAQAS